MVNGHALMRRNLEQIEHTHVAIIDRSGLWQLFE